jgi:hypothetical protein
VAVLTACVAPVAGGCWEPYVAEHAEEPIPVTQSPSITRPARLRLIHASPDAPPVEVYANSQPTPLLADVEYGETTPYLTLPTGTYRLTVRAKGTAAPAPPLLTTEALFLDPDEMLTLVAVGQLASDDAEARFRVLPVEEAFGTADPGTARVRILHAGADAPMVALDVGDDGTVEVQRLARFSVTDPRGLSVPAGTPLQLGVLTGEPRRRLTGFTVPALPAGAQVFLVSTGLLSEPSGGDAGFALLAANPDTTLGFVRQNPVVYALHASPDAPAVDLFAGATELTDGLAFGALSGTLQVPPGRYTLDLFPHAPGAQRPATAPVASGATEDLEPGRRYLVTAAGFLAPRPDTRGFTLLSVAETFPRDATSARLRLVHAAPDAPGVDVGPLENGRVPTAAAYDNVAFGTASAPPGLPLPPTPTWLGVVPADALERQPLFSFQVDPQPLLGRGLFAVEAGAWTPAPGEQGFQLLLVDTTASPWTVGALAP